MPRLVSREFDADPSLLLRVAAAFPQRYPVLLDSASAGALARYSVLVSATGRDALWVGRMGRAGASGEASAVLGSQQRPGPSFLGALDAWWRRLAWPAAADAANGLHGPFAGGLVVFLGYEIAAQIEPRLTGRMPAAPEPIGAFALRCPAALVLDHQAGTLRAVAEAGDGQEALLDQIEEDLRRAPALPARRVAAGCRHAARSPCPAARAVGPCCPG